MGRVGCMKLGDRKKDVDAFRPSRGTRDAGGRASSRSIFTPKRFQYVRRAAFGRWPKRVWPCLDTALLRPPTTTRDNRVSHILRCDMGHSAAVRTVDGVPAAAFCHGGAWPGARIGLAPAPHDLSGTVRAPRVCCGRILQ